MRYSSINVVVLGLFLFSAAAMAFVPQQVAKVATSPGKGYTGLQVVLNEHIGALETLKIYLSSPYLNARELSPFEIESILVPAAKESNATRDPMRYHILEEKIAEVETTLYSTLLKAREHLQEEEVRAYEHMYAKHEERRQIHRDIATSIQQVQWGWTSIQQEVNASFVNKELYHTTDPLYANHAKRWKVFALTVDNKELQQTNIAALLNTYRENIEQQKPSAAPRHDSEDGWMHVAALLKNHPRDNESNSTSDSYFFDIIYAVREHVDVSRIALLHALKHHLLQQQVDLTFRTISDYRPDIKRAHHNNKQLEDFGLAIYHLLKDKPVKGTAAEPEQKIGLQPSLAAAG